MVDNPPAFPVVVHQSIHTKGMTLRDYMAGQALVGIVTAGDMTIEDTAGASYTMADAMLKARDAS